jgi:hypothetical protein
MMARYCIGADALASSQLTGNLIGESGGGGGGNIETIGIEGAVKAERPLLNHCQKTR